MRARPRAGNSLHRVFQSTIGTDRLREPVDGGTRLRSSFHRRSGGGLREREHVENDLRAIDAICLDIGIRNARRGGGNMGTARQIALLDAANQPALRIVNMICRPVSKVEVLGVVSISPAMMTSGPRSSRQRGRIMGNV